MYQNDAMKVLTGEVRLSYANLTTPRAAQQGGEPQVFRHPAHPQERCRHQG